jgi:hypothetical protein
VRRGTKHCGAGAKVYLAGAFWGMGGEQVTVIGQHRASKRYIVLSMASRHLTNWRAQLVYRPAILRLLHEHGSSGEWGADEAAKKRVHEVAEGFVHREETRKAESHRAPLGRTGPMDVGGCRPRC